MSIGSSAIGAAAIGASPQPLLVFKPESPDAEKSLIEVVSHFDRALIESIRRVPEDLRTIDRRDFERLVAELFSGFGYDVELTRRTKDGGKDIIAVRRREVNVRFLIECKRPDPGNPVSVSRVRELFGVKQDDGATKAILATTTHFTPDARRFEERHRWELELRDYEAVLAWIDVYLKSAR